MDGKKPSGLKIFGIVTGGILLVLLLTAILLSYVASAKIERLRAETKARTDALRQADPARPTLRGGSEPGNAWDDYKVALDDLKNFAGAPKLADLVRRDPKADPALGQAALGGLTRAIDAVHRGAGRASSRYPYDWDQGPRMQFPPMAAANQAGQLLVLRARALMEEGKPREAAGVLIDLLQFGRDMGADGLLISEMVGYAMILIGLEEMQEHFAAGKFDKETLGDVDRALATLDATLPNHGQTLLNDVQLFGGMGDLSIAGGWGPQRYLYADGMEKINALVERVAAADALPWPAAQSVFTQVEVDAMKSWNPIVKMAVPATSRTHGRVRAARAQVRLLRVAVHHAATGELLDLDDPFGTKLKSAKSDAGLKLWSVGQDGVDDLGSGDWKTKESKDIVLDGAKR